MAPFAQVPTAYDVRVFISQKLAEEERHDKCAELISKIGEVMRSLGVTEHKIMLSNQKLLSKESELRLSWLRKNRKTKADLSAQAKFNAAARLENKRRKEIARLEKRGAPGTWYKTSKNRVPSNLTLYPRRVSPTHEGFRDVNTDKNVGKMDWEGSNVNPMLMGYPMMVNTSHTPGSLPHHTPTKGSADYRMLAEHRYSALNTPPQVNSTFELGSASVFTKTSGDKGLAKKAMILEDDANLEAFKRNPGRRQTLLEPTTVDEEELSLFVSDDEADQTPDQPYRSEYQPQYSPRTPHGSAAMYQDFSPSYNTAEYASTFTTPTSPHWNTMPFLTQSTQNTPAVYNYSSTPSPLNCNYNPFVTQSTQSTQSTLYDYPSTPISPSMPTIPETSPLPDGSNVPEILQRENKREEELERQVQLMQRKEAYEKGVEIHEQMYERRVQEVKEFAARMGKERVEMFPELEGLCGKYDVLGYKGEDYARRPTFFT